VYRILADFVEPIPKADTFVPAEHTFFHVLQVAVSRDPENEMLFALKGGTNGESHNHNDVGQIILFDHGEPVIMDAGVETYCRDTFSDRRYTLWAMRGRYHNIAEFGGVEQKPGGNYHADTVSYDEATGELALELKNAYPTEAGIVSYVRRGILDGHTVRLTDTVSLDAEKEACFRYLTVDEPTVEGNTVRFATGHVMTFAPALQAVIDYVEPDKGGKLAREWKRDKFWRITLKADAVKDAAFATTITRA
ncbi:MAG: heparinase II/III-family protein, partial [Clostridia bacterium]|nr:heparinase II/III-family protein [Clostridia bacterium]